MINLDSITNKNNKEYNEKWPYILDHPYRILIIGGSGSGKTYALLNLINEQDDIEKIYLYAKDLSEPKYEFLIKKREDAGTKHLNNLNAFIEFSNTINGVYENINDYNPSIKRKILIVFDHMIADVMSNNKFQTIIKKLFLRCRKLNVSHVFITQSSFSVPKDARLNSTHYLIMKINKKELQYIAINHSVDIDYKDFMKIYRECTKEPFNTMLPASDPQRFTKKLILIKMTLTDELKILDNKIEANQAQYDLGREAAKISALSSKDLLEKYEYLTGEDLGHRPSVLEKTKFEYSPLVVSFSKAFEKDKAKSGAKSKIDFNYESIHKFYEFYKRYDEFEEMSLGSKYKKINDFNKRLNKF